MSSTEKPAERVAQLVGQKVDDIGGYIRSQRERRQVSLRQLARTAGVSNPYLSQIERGLRKPSAEILQQIARGLRISAEALYVRAGILDERPASAVTDAVLADPTLTERQKQVLLDIYQSFRRETDAATARHRRGVITMAVSLPTAADVRKAREQAAKSAAERAEVARTPLLAVLGAGELRRHRGQQGRHRRDPGRAADARTRATAPGRGRAAAASPSCRSG